MSTWRVLTTRALIAGRTKNRVRLATGVVVVVCLVAVGSAAAGVIYGTARADLLRGGPGVDFIFGKEGNDRLLGGPGNDWLYGGPGNDRLEGGSGADRFFCGAGRDTVIATKAETVFQGCEVIRRIGNTVPVTPAPPAGPPLGARDNPIPMVSGYLRTADAFQITVLSIIPNANDLVAAAQTSSFKHPPAPGYQYFIARIQLKYVGTASKKFSSFSDIRGRTDAAPRLAAIGPSNTPYRAYVQPTGNPPNAQTCIDWPDELPNKEMFAGETLTGNACWHVRSDEVGSLLMFDDEASNYLYLSLHP